MIQKSSWLILRASQWILSYYTTCCTMTSTLVYPKKTLLINPLWFKGVQWRCLPTLYCGSTTSSAWKSGSSNQLDFSLIFLKTRLEHSASPWPPPWQPCAHSLSSLVLRCCTFISVLSLLTNLVTNVFSTALLKWSEGYYERIQESFVVCLTNLFDKFQQDRAVCFGTLLT